MKNVIFIIILSIIPTITNALFFDGPKSKCSSLSNAACNNDNEKKK